MERLPLIALFTLLSSSFGAIAKLDLPLPSPPPLTPQETYEFYYEFSKENEDFEKELNHFSEAKEASMKSQIDDYVESKKLPREDAISMFMQATKKMAECGDLDFKGVSRDDNSAVLFYIVKDVCEGGEYIQRVAMVKEGGWKVEEVVTVLE